MPTTLPTMLFYLVGVHFLCDYPLQGPFLSAAKNRHNKEGANGMWVHAMFAHGFIHGFGVALITGSVILGLAEFCLHTWIDLFKCEGKINIHTDQTAHLLCKLAWAWLAVTSPDIP